MTASLVETVIENVTDPNAAGLLLATDRCDRCSSAAIVHVTLRNGGELLFCKHHYSQHQEVILPPALKVRDESKVKLA